MSPDEYEDPSVLYEAISTHEKVYMYFSIYFFDNISQ